MSDPASDRLMELLVSRATEGLNRSEDLELDALLAAYPQADATGFDLAAATLDLAFEGEIEEMPAELRATIARQAEFYMQGTEFNAARRVEARGRALGTGAAAPEGPRAPRPATPTVTPIAEADRGGSRWFANTGWLAAAASLAFALLKPGAPPEPVPGPATGTELRMQLLSEDPAALRLPWSATEDAAATGAGGDVLWSADRQQGVMHIEGLAANDPGQLQYQLWIFDKERDERYPVDGGVFDVPAGASSVDVPIRATLPVDKPVLFAVTVEKPGGVMVSSRERIVLVAQPS